MVRFRPIVIKKKVKPAKYKQIELSGVVGTYLKVTGTKVGEKQTYPYSFTKVFS